MSDTLTDREALQALLDGEVLQGERGPYFRMRGDTLYWWPRGHPEKPAVGKACYARMRRPPPEPATFADAIPHLLAGRRVRRESWPSGSAWDMGPSGQRLRHVDSVVPSVRERETFASNDWLVEIDGRWVSAKTEVGE